MVKPMSEMQWRTPSREITISEELLAEKKLLAQFINESELDFLREVAIGYAKLRKNVDLGGHLTLYQHFMIRQLDKNND